MAAREELTAEERVARAILASFEPTDAVEFMGYLGVVFSL